MQADTTELNEIVHSHRSVDAGVSGGLSAIIFFIFILIIPTGNCKNARKKNTSNFRLRFSPGRVQKLPVAQGVEKRVH